MNETEWNCKNNDKKKSNYQDLDAVRYLIVYIKIHYVLFTKSLKSKKQMTIFRFFYRSP